MMYKIDTMLEAKDGRWLARTFGAFRDRQQAEIALTALAGRPDVLEAQILEVFEPGEEPNQ